MIKDNETSLAIFASRYLDTLPTAELFEWIDDKSAEVRTLVARNLQCRGTKEVYKFAKKRTKSSKVYQREIAAFILGQLGCLFTGSEKYPFKLQSKSLLMSLVDDRSKSVRAAAIAGLGHLYIDGLDKDIENLVIRHSKDKSKVVRIALSITLGASSGNKKIRKIYTDYLKQGGEVAEWAEVGLEILNDRLQT
ncbi:hypothetical protein [Acinetobacter larvae]|uniref:HEAT repeat domain-containing protein n=1 Tax=Acinetobacter larvae TaxID=1789224 RepID=A0A1B2LVX4_9GAMM|nr:hypothetical protein [Acinetobacter larvae]AOA57087.1 hypothetical protein BFG52_01125 [Acinetobacter larvae]